MREIVSKSSAAVLKLILVMTILLCNSAVAASELNLPQQKTDFPIHVVQKTGSDTQNRVIVFMADGYTEQQQEQFIRDVTVRARGMLEYEPFKSYANKLNIYAVMTVSEESGVSTEEDKKNTYFHVKHYGSTTFFGSVDESLGEVDGNTKARQLKEQMESLYLDEGAVVSTIHILSNSPHYFGSSIGGLFSFSSLSEDGEGGAVATHEIAHSFGRLGDEYGRVRNKANTSQTNNPDEVEWKKLLGFRGVGITLNGNHNSSYIPGPYCIMRELGYEFCEVCRMGLARYLNYDYYTEQPDKFYVADPDITIEHDKISTVGKLYDNVQINESNIEKANGHDLEFRTIVQNFTNQQQSIKLMLSILGSDNQVKYSEEKTFILQPLDNWYNPDAARESCSITVTSENLPQLKRGDKLDGSVIDVSTGEVLATNKTRNREWSKINIRYQIITDNDVSTAKQLPNTGEAEIPFPKGTVYRLDAPQQIGGFSYVGNSLNTKEVIVDKSSLDIVYYYEVTSDTEGSEQNGASESPGGASESASDSKGDSNGGSLESSGSSESNSEGGGSSGLNGGGSSSGSGRDSENSDAYAIEAVSGDGGTISPAGSVTVDSGGSKRFTITANDGYKIVDVVVDGKSTGAVSEYAFENVADDHTITVTFVKIVKDTASPIQTGVAELLNVSERNAFMNGYGDGDFRPNDNMTRLQAAQIFYNLLIDKNIKSSYSFRDVSADEWYSEAVNTLGSMGIINGYSDGRFEPGGTITRAEFTAIAMRFAKPGADVENTFSDISEDDWFYGNIVSAASYGWINGYSDGRFYPSATITRAEAATIVNRMLGRSCDFSTADKDDLRKFNDVGADHWAYYQIMEATNSHLN